ncbi:PEP-CTERM sorting domain-containing protein [Thioalkalivibrio sp. ALJ24]|uniref:PEP-CTERM sorting domain-containing protein n=1 Tax=Thioalkalivibrio sp. ALJ24 TaxID=545276 RepID=UPI00037998F7|nr:PEP-CTERM sorting domain-containing protein [Thioalkalivibrio sp. ALJ24]
MIEKYRFAPMVARLATASALAMFWMHTAAAAPITSLEDDPTWSVDGTGEIVDDAPGDRGAAFIEGGSTLVGDEFDISSPELFDGDPVTASFTVFGQAGGDLDLELEAPNDRVSGDETLSTDEDGWTDITATFNIPWFLIGSESIAPDFANIDFQADDDMYIDSFALTAESSDFEGREFTLGEADFGEVAEVPVPATWILMAAGVAGLGLIRRKRLRGQAAE